MTPSVEASQWLGESRVVVVLVDFSGAAHSVSFDGLRANLRSLTDFYVDQSFGKLTLQVDLDPHWHTVSGRILDYLPGNTFASCCTTQRQLIAEALELADADVDYSKYDFVVVLHADSSDAGAYGSWGFSPELGWGCVTHLDNSCQDRVALVNEYDFGRRNMVGFHEFGHLLGLPDLYSFELAEKTGDSWKADAFVRGYELMGGSSRLVGLSAWSRLRLGWIPSNQSATIVGVENKTIDLAPLELGRETLAVRIMLSPQDYYVIEYRQRIGYDKSIPDYGVLLYLAQDHLQSGSGPLRLAINHPLRLGDKPNLSDVMISLVEISTSYARIHVESLLGTSALSSIRQAEVSIQRAVTQKRTVELQRANQILSHAYQAFSTGDYSSAESLAQLAEQLAIASTSETTNLISTSETTNLISSSTNLASAVTGQGTLWPQTNLVIAVCAVTILVIATIALTRKRH